ncbi:MAG TPA: hypothetical protein VJS44_15780 [Pyrinomonadaceae bacterium]|nr:hypothetical protein [Pyrinomonadaceae bacterium]
MKRWKKFTLLLLGLLLLSQTPFVYRRFQLRALRAKIHELNASRVVNEADAFKDYKGVVHVHSFLGGHSTGNFTEIVEAARQNGLGFVVMTEHPSASVDTAELTLKGEQGGVLFINGNEASTSAGDRFLVMPGDVRARSSGTKTTQDFITEEKQDGRLLFLAYPMEFRSWDAAEGYNGIEVYNLYTNARRINPLVMFFDGLWSYGAYPDLLFTRFYERPTESLKRWDDLNNDRARRLVALAGNDAHQNVGLHLGDAGGKKYLGLLLDPYSRSFQIVRTHALLEKEKALTTDTLLEALSRGHCYIAFDLLSDSTGFRFTARSGNSTAIMGDSLALSEGDTRLQVATPIKSRIVLFRNGQRLDESPDALGKEFAVKERGVYRVEVYLDALGPSFRDRPWIISNPIYIE